MDLQDDEYAVYSTNQQRIRYIVEFTLPGDKPDRTTLPVSDSEGAVYSEETSDDEETSEEGTKSGTIGQS